MNSLVIIAGSFVSLSLVGIGWACEHAKRAEEEERRSKDWMERLIAHGFEKIEKVEECKG